MEHIQHEINFLAVAVTAAILWVIGAAWYSPVLFAKPWAKLVGVSKETARPGFMVLGMICSYVGDFVVALALAHLMVWSGAPTFGWGVFIGCLVWLAFYGAIQMPQTIFENKPFKLFAINGAYWLIGLGLSGGILAVWR